MTYEQVIEQILQSTDEAFIGVGEAQARYHFTAALGAMLQSGDYKQEEILKLLLWQEYTFTGSEAGIVDLPTICSSAIIKLLNVIPDFDSTAAISLVREDAESISKYAIHAGS